MCAVRAALAVGDLARALASYPGPVLPRSDAPGVERAQAKVVTFDVDEPVPYQIDGDPMGECSRLEASSLARVLEVMTPGRRP